MIVRFVNFERALAGYADVLGGLVLLSVPRRMLVFAPSLTLRVRVFREEYLARCGAR